MAFRGVEIPLEGVNDLCIIGAWEVYVNAVTGEYVGSIHEPPASLCPDPTPTG